MKLQCYALSPDPPALVPAVAAREWMDATPDRHAYRCLPLAIANGHGWEIRSPCAFEVEWNGGESAADLVVRSADGDPRLSRFAVSHFACGVLTLHPGYLFRTEPGWHLLATGPFNRPKDGIAPLTGVVETDWLPYPFTMNWRATRPGTVRFERDEPVCLVFPVKAGALPRVQPEIRDIGDDPELEAEMQAWRERRETFMEKFRRDDPATLREAWQRFYFTGRYATGAPAERPHASKLRVAAPVDLRGRGR